MSDVTRAPRIANALGAIVAWAFVVVTLAHLAFVLYANPLDGLVTLYQTEVDGVVHRAMGLHYVGAGGLALAIGQIAVVVTASALTIGRRPARARARRLGHAILIAWALIWLVDLGWIAILDRGADALAYAGVAFVCFAATLDRAARAIIRDRTESAVPHSEQREETPTG